MGAITVSTPIAATEVCPSCGEFSVLDDANTGWCAGCVAESDLRIKAFLITNADHLEHYMQGGLSVRQAIKRVATDVKPTCAVCGKPMNRAKRNAVICRRTLRCRQTARRYVYLYSRKGYTKAEALAKVLES